MRNVLIASVLAASVSACCGAYAGGGDRVYQRSGSEMLILCDNGGFVANLSSTTLEGRFTQTSAGFGTATTGTDGQIAFDFMTNDDGSASTPQLGETPWLALSLDQTALDHANVMCTDLESRPWWTAQ